MKPFHPLEEPTTGFQMIEASAGCGKTYTITTLFLRLLMESGMEAEEILVVTFTEAAAAELKSRIRSRIEEALGGRSDDPTLRQLAERTEQGGRVLARALRRLDRASIFTIHGYCRRVLREQAFESGASFDAELSADKSALFSETACDGYVNIAHTLSPMMLTFFEHRGITPDRFLELLETVTRSGRLRLLPDEAPVADPGEAFEATRTAVAALLAKNRSELARFYNEYPDIDRRSYSSAHVPRWVDAVYRAATSPFPDTAIFDAARRFTTEAIADKMKNGASPPCHPLTELADTLSLLERQADAYVVQLKRRFLAAAEENLARRKGEREIQTFDDLLLTLYDALDGPRRDALVAAVRAKYKAVLIDEFQDTDAVQYEIFHRLFGNSAIPFYAIGDPKQAIYGFRGGDIYTYLRAADAAGDRRCTLGVNYRSDPSVLVAVNHLFSRLDNPFLFERISFSPAAARPDARDAFAADENSGPLTVKFLDRAAFGAPTDKPLSSDWAGLEMPAAVAADIRGALSQQDLRGAPVTPSRIAVLVRTNRQAMQMRDALLDEGIDAVLMSDGSVFDTPEAEAFGRLLQGVHRPARLNGVRAALAAPLFGLNASRLAALRDDPPRMDEWTARFLEWRRIWEREGVYKMFQAVLDYAIDGAAPDTRPPLFSDGGRALTNYRHLAELVGKKQAEEGLTETGLVQWYSRRCTEAREGAVRDEEAALRLESDREAVRILTMHKAKGLEFDLVYCTHLWTASEGSGRGGAPPVFHDPTAENALTVDLSEPVPEAHRKQAAFEAEAEGMRLAYVALTRAKQRCVVVLGAFKSLPKSPAGRLFFSRADDLSELSDETLMRRARETLSGATDTIRIVEMVPPAASQPMSESPTAPQQTAPLPRQFSRRLAPKERQTSFSALAAEQRAAEDVFAEEGADRDRTAARIPVEKAPAVPADTEKMSLTSFDRGPRAGTCLHAIFERLDFERPDREIAAEVLAEFGYDPAWVEPIFSDLKKVLDCPLSPDDPESALRRIPSAARLNELAFLFPTQAVGEFAAGLERLFTKHAKVCGRAYAARLGSLFPRLMPGFVKGFIDLVYEYRGRFYIVDYKSNHLGDRPEAYDLPALREEMAAHHYYLQYHLYVAALHRYLRARIPDYRYETHFGGVYYLFIRGMTGERGRGYGVFTDRPSAGIVSALSELFEGRAVPAPPPPMDTAAVQQLALPGFGAPRDKKGDA